MNLMLMCIVLPIALFFGAFLGCLALALKTVRQISKGIKDDPRTNDPSDY
jgi:uncharacterized protein YneF (UPF0154 family)